MWSFRARSGLYYFTNVLECTCPVQWQFCGWGFAGPHPCGFSKVKLHYFVIIKRSVQKPSALSVVSWQRAKITNAVVKHNKLFTVQHCTYLWPPTYYVLNSKLLSLVLTTMCPYGSFTWLIPSFPSSGRCIYTEKLKIWSTSKFISVFR